MAKGISEETAMADMMVKESSAIRAKEDTITEEFIVIPEKVVTISTVTFVIRVKEDVTEKESFAIPQINGRHLTNRL